MVQQRPERFPPFPPQGIRPPGLESKMSPKPNFTAPAYREANKLEGRIALITGGDSGIGRAVAFLYAREGAEVAIVYLPEEQTDADRIAQLVKEKTGRELFLIPGNVSDQGFCHQAVLKTIERFGQLDILVNNAAFQHHCDLFEEITAEQWDKTFRTNIYGYYYMVQAALPYLKKGASILNTGSVVGTFGNKKLIDYAATKGAIHAFTKSLAQNLMSRGIRVNCIAPGPVWTPLNPAERPPDDMRDFGADTPIGRPAQPEEIAPAYVFLASEADSSYISGEVLSIFGGDGAAG